MPPTPMASEYGGPSRRSTTGAERPDDIAHVWGRFPAAEKPIQDISVRLFKELGKRGPLPGRRHRIALFQVALQNQIELPHPAACAPAQLASCGSGLARSAA